MIENNKNSFKRLDFPTITPLKSTMTQNDFCSAQKQKYEIPLKLNQASFLQSSDTFNNQKEIYENQIPIAIKSSEREDWTTYLNLKISFVQSPKSHSQMLHLELTDEANNLFLYTLNLNETEFLTLKNEQSLLVDFQCFPSKLMELLELCINNQSSKEEKVSFSCVFDIKNNGDAFLNIVENNQFKSLIHLALKFRASTDEILKAFLSSKLSKEKQENEDLRIRNQKLEEGLTMKNSELVKYDNELKKFLYEKEKIIEQISLDEQKKLNDLQQSYLEREGKFLKESEFEKKSLVEKYERTLNELQKKNENFSFVNNELSEAKMILESKERELSSKLGLLTKENAVLQRECESLKIDSKNLEFSKYSQEKTLTEFMVKNESLDKQMQGKDEIINKNKEILENAYRQRDMSESNLNEAKKNIEKLEIKLNKCSEEITKGNDIIRQLQDDITKKKEKIKLKNSLIVQQEQTINQINENCDKYIRQINQCQKDRDNQEIRVKELENTVNDFKEKLMESQKIIESNNSMIQYLNRNLNETQKPVSFNPNATTSTKNLLNKYASYGQMQTNEYRNENKNYMNNPLYSTNFDENKYKGDFKGGYTSVSGINQNNSKSSDISTSKSPLRVRNEGTEKQQTNQYYESKYQQYKQEKTDSEDLKEKYLGSVPQRKPQTSTAHLSISNKIDADTQISMTIKPVKYRDPSNK